MHIILISLIAVVVMTCAFFLVRRKKRTMDLNYTCPDGNFHIKGQQERFKIYKGERFIFEVVDGQITSFVDNAASETTIDYGG